MADEALVEAIIRFKAENLGVAQEARAAIAGLGTEVSGVNLSLNNHSRAASEAAVAERDITSEANAAARALGPVGDAGARAAERLVALGGVIGSGGALGLGIGAGVVALGGLVMGLEQLRSNTESAARASYLLGQAYASQGESVRNAGAWVNKFIEDNARNIQNQYEVEQAIAQATRAGIDQITVQRMASDALDISAATGRDYASVMQGLIMLHAGNARGLEQLGMSTTEADKAMGKLHGTVTNYNRVLGILEQSYGGAANAEGAAIGGANKLTMAWQDLMGTGSPLGAYLDKLQSELADVVNWFNKGTGAATVFRDAIMLVVGAGLPGLGPSNSARTGFDTTGLIPMPDGSWMVPTVGSNPNLQQSTLPLQANNSPANVTINVYGSGDPQQAANLTAQQISTMYGR